MAENWSQKYATNPITVIPASSLLYFALSPFGTSNDGVALWSSVLANIAAALPGGTQVMVVTGASQAMVPNTVYIINNPSSAVTLTLPATTNPGDMLKVVGFSADGWIIQSGAGQEIHFGADSPSVGGSISSTMEHDSVELITAVANTDFVVTNLIGNVTFT